MKRRIDFNADVGEGVDPAADEPLVGLVTSVNIACGGHAGTRETMRALVEMALRRRVAIGAHPGYPDRENFGREPMALSPAELRATIADQVGALLQVVREAGATLRHVKPHGALYNQAVRDPEIAGAIAEAVLEHRADLILVGLAGSTMLDVWRSYSFRIAAEAFADRRYEADGTLRSRRNADALILDPVAAAGQAVDIVARQRVLSVDGTSVPVIADTLCIHGDTPGALQLATVVRGGLEIAGVEIRALGT